MRSSRIGRRTRQRHPYRSLICAVLGQAYRDALDGEDVDWTAIPWRQHVGISVAALRRRLRHERN